MVGFLPQNVLRSRSGNAASASSPSRSRRAFAMTATPPVKLLPRNVAALRPGQNAAAGAQLVVGNSVSTRLESAIGNCFPGLEFDARNLERRFFPFLEMELGDQVMQVASVDLDGVAAAALPPADKQTYRSIASDLKQGRNWSVERIKGDFGPLGPLDFALSDLHGRSFGEGRLPSDGWTAARLLKEGSAVTLRLTRRPKATPLTLTGSRVRYLE